MRVHMGEEDNKIPENRARTPFGPIVRIIEVYFVLVMATVLGYALLMPAGSFEYDVTLLRSIVVMAAAALGAGLDIGEPKGRMVVDVGGGVTDAAIIALGTVAASASLPAAGDAFDRALIRYVREEKNVDVGRRAAEGLKVAVGRHDISVIRVHDPRERTIPDVGLVHVKDSETGEGAWINTSSRKVRNAYSAWFGTVSASAAKLFNRYQVDSVDIATDEDYVRGLMNLFHRR